MANALFQLISMPNAPIVSKVDGTLNPVWVHYLGQIERVAQALSQVNDQSSQMVKAASLAPTAFGTVAAAYTRAGATYTTAEMTAALDEIKGTILPALSANALALQALMATLLAGQKTAQQMET